VTSGGGPAELDPVERGEAMLQPARGIVKPGRGGYFVAPMIKKILMWTGVSLVSIVAILVITVAFRWNRTFDAPYPPLVASRDTAVIARGRYLAYGPAHCSDCHTPPSERAALRAGTLVPLSGGMLFDIPPGKFHVPNLTPDSAMGIGRRSDGEIARMLRYGVRADGRAALPFMEYQYMSDSDVVAVISFLRSQAPVAHAVPDHQFTWIGKAVMAFVIKPVGPSSPPPATAPPRGPTLERGAYLVDAIANCAGCHTQRSMVSGAFTGPKLQGGIAMETNNPAVKLTPPDLTSRPGGRTALWTEDEFVARFRAGERIPGTPMPWQPFGRMSDDDLRSIYRYLKSVPVSGPTP